jgi:diaminopimelate epimerase
MRFAKYHALGNDYIVVDGSGEVESLSAAEARLICDRHYGVGSDGVLLGPLPDDQYDFRLRLYNPDGGEFEKSGNGLRIFARYLWDQALVGDEAFTINTPGGAVTARVVAGGRSVSVAMGRISFHSRDIPVTGPAREVLREELVIGGEALTYCAATIGNPHCVVLRPRISAEDARRWGPVIERDPRFPNRTNVQVLAVRDRSNIEIEIWERGVGYTLASGSSSCAAAAVAHRLGWCDSPITVHMPGGALTIEIGPDYAVTMSGPVTPICQGTLSSEIMSRPPGRAHLSAQGATGA